jgi:hypothetical protein
MTDPTPSLPVTVASDNYVVSLEDGLPAVCATPLIRKLEANHARVLADLGLGTGPKVTIRLWNGEARFLDVMQQDIGTRYTGAAGYVFSSTEVRVLNRGEADQTALHECCHALSLRLNASLINRPRWLWEAVATFESGEFRDPNSLAYLVAGRFPTLQELNADYNEGDSHIYEVGYLLGDYILSAWGRQGWIDLITSGGDLPGTFGISEIAFQEGWKTYIRRKYQFGAR